MGRRPLPWWRRLALFCERRWHRVHVRMTRTLDGAVWFTLYDARAAVSPAVRVPRATLEAFADYVAMLAIDQAVVLVTPTDERVHVPACAVELLRDAARYAAEGRPVPLARTATLD